MLENYRVSKQLGISRVVLSSIELFSYINLSRGHVQYFECQNVAKHTKMHFNVNYIGNAGCFKNSFTMIFQMLLCGECYEIIYV
jgi:hypothetical protein